MPDRLAKLIASTMLNGINFVETTSADQTGLRAHFLNRVAVAGSLADSNPVTITGGEATPTVPVLPIAAADWSVDDAGRPLLALRTPFRGDFSTYTLTIRSTALDAYYTAIGFTFKAGCPSTLDCLTCDDEETPTGSTRRSTTSPRTTRASGPRCWTTRPPRTRHGSSATSPTSAWCSSSCCRRSATT